MHCTRKITEDFTFVGGADRRLSLFEGVYEVPNGITYNSYLLCDEKTVLFDTVDASIGKIFFENIEAVLSGRTLDYVIVQHLEPDHSATLAELLLRYPDVTVICGPRAEKMLPQFLARECRLLVKKEGETLATGRHLLHFLEAPMVHWPEVIVTYDETDKILFSADAFGTFGAQNGALFADEVDFNLDYLSEARRYYCNIVGKYGTQVQALLQKASKLNIAMICPLHGFVWRRNLSDYLEKYEQWSTYTPEKNGVMLAYASIYGNTANAADILACRLQEAGIPTVVYDVSVTPAATVIAAAFEYSHLVFAAPTYNSGVFVRMEELLRDLAAHGIRNRTVGLLENGSWAPTSGRQMRELLSSCRDITFLEQTVTIKSSLKEEQVAALEALAGAIQASVLEAVAAKQANQKTAEAVPANIDPTALFKLSYGLFVLTVRDNEKDNGCIINTAIQVTGKPNRLALAVNKQNLTHDMILATGKFNLSVLSEEVPFRIFEHFGFQSGHTVNKFADFPCETRSENGLLYLTENTSALLSGSVYQSVDCGTHTLFLADVTEAKILSDTAPVTYAYYFAHIKPKPQKKASSSRIWVCKICGYIYDEGAEGVKFEDLPEDWVCPLCKHPKADFELQE